MDRMSGFILKPGTYNLERLVLEMTGLVLDDRCGTPLSLWLVPGSCVEFLAVVGNDPGPFASSRNWTAFVTGFSEEFPGYGYALIAWPLYYWDPYLVARACCGCQSFAGSGD